MPGTRREEEMFERGETAKAVFPDNYGWLERRLKKKEMDYLWDCIDQREESFKRNLAGQIDSSYSIPDPNNWFFNNVLKQLIHDYQQVFTNSISYGVPTSGSHPLFMSTFWVNYQKQHEYQPPHYHTGVYSFVIWMKIPTSFEDQRWMSNSKDAKAQFNSAFEFQYLDIMGHRKSKIYPLDPSYEGYMLFFPSLLTHAVYPFYDCEEERISISGNLLLNSSIDNKGINMIPTLNPNR